MVGKPTSPESLKDSAVRALRCKDCDRFSFSVGQGLSIDVRRRKGSNAHLPELKTWVYRYRSHSGDHRSIRIGTYPTTSVKDAVRRFRELRLQVESGRDPWAEEQATALQAAQEARSRVTVSALVDRYLALHARPKKRSWREDERILHKEVLSRWAERSIVDVSRADIIQMLNEIRGRGAHRGADQTLAIVKRMFNWAVEDQALLEVSPCDRIRKGLSDKASTRDRALTDDEIRLFFTALSDLPVSRDASDALTLQLLTAQRLGEIVGMQWSEIDFNARTWTIPGRKAKNGHTHVVPLSSPVLSILNSRPRLLRSDFVFPGSRGTEHMNRSGASRWIPKIHRDPRFAMPHFTAHDLRHTAATGMARMGVDRYTIQRILNHVDGSMTARYVQYDYDREKREALERWAERVAEVPTRAASTNPCPTSS